MKITAPRASSPPCASSIDALGGFVRGEPPCPTPKGAAREIGRGVGAVVASLQFHDIVRQQVEHVEHALLEAADMAKGLGGEGASTSARSSAGSATSASCRPPRCATPRILPAVDRVVGELRGLAGHVGRLGDDIEGLVGGSRQQSLLARVEQALGVVNEAMGDFSRPGRGHCRDHEPCKRHHCRNGQFCG